MDVIEGEIAGLPCFALPVCIGLESESGFTGEEVVVDRDSIRKEVMDERDTLGDELYGTEGSSRHSDRNPVVNESVVHDAHEGGAMGGMLGSSTPIDFNELMRMVNNMARLVEKSTGTGVLEPTKMVDRILLFKECSNISLFLQSLEAELNGGIGVRKEDFKQILVSKLPYKIVLMMC